MNCIYPVYVETYDAIANAMRRNDVKALRSAFLAASFLDGPAAVAAVAAQVDAANRLPMSSRVHVCRMLTGGACSAECHDAVR